MHFRFFTFCYLISFSSFSFWAFSWKHSFFCWSSKSHGTGREGFYFSKFSSFIIFLKINRPRKIPFGGSNIRVLEGRGLAESIINNPPYSVREWSRFLTKLSRLLSKSDCFQSVLSDTLVTTNSAAEGYQLSALLV